MHVCDDDGIDGMRIDTTFGKRGPGLAQNRAIAGFSFGGVVAGIDDNCAIPGLHGPDEIIHGMRAGVVIVQDE